MSASCNLPQLQKLPFDILYEISKYLQVHDVIHLSQSSPHLEGLTEVEVLCRQIVEVSAYFTYLPTYVPKYLGTQSTYLDNLPTYLPTYLLSYPHSYVRNVTITIHHPCSVPSPKRSDCTPSRRKDHLTIKAKLSIATTHRIQSDP